MRLTIIYIFLFFFPAISLFSQPCPDCPPPGDPTSPVPISGIEILIGLGGIYGAKKIIDRKRKK